MAIVKADAYGHSAIHCSLALERAGVDWFGVALPEEAIALREAGITKPILALGGFWEGQEGAILDYCITPALFSLDKARRLNDYAKKRNLIADVHLKVDTGMGRVGVRHEEFPSLVKSLQDLKSLRIDGLMTHFAAADDPAQNEFTALQIERFQVSLEVLRKAGFSPRFMNLANSPGAIAHPSAVKDMVRIGGILYGLGDDVLPRNVQKPELRPVLSLFSRVSHLKTVPAGESVGYSRTFTTARESTIATIPIGYHDGLPRALSNIGRVLIRGRFAPIVGRVSMDWIIVDVTDIPHVSLDDLVTIIGTDSGLTISAADLGSLTGTISYEITCGLNSRIYREYVEEP